MCIKKENLRLQIRRVYVVLLQYDVDLAACEYISALFKCDPV